MRYLFSAFAAAALLTFAASPAQAQLGGLLGGLTDPVEDLLDDVDDTVDDLVDDVDETVDDLLDDTTETVGNLVNNTTSTVGNVVNNVTGAVDGVLDGVLPGGDGAAPPADYGFLIPGAGGAGELPDSLIAQLRMLIEIIRARDWMVYGDLARRPRVGAVDLRRWVPQDSWGDLNTVMVNYAPDIMALQQSILAGNVLPGWTGFRRLPVSRVVAFDFQESDGTIVIYFS